MEKQSVVYLAHFDTPYQAQSGQCKKQAQHYCGMSVRFDERMKEHRTGQGNPLLRAVSQAGIHWSIVVKISGGHALERAMKNGKHLARYCPVCYPNTYQRALYRLIQKLG